MVDGFLRVLRGFVFGPNPHHDQHTKAARHIALSLFFRPPTFRTPPLGGILSGLMSPHGSAPPTVVPV